MIDAKRAITVFLASAALALMTSLAGPAIAASEVQAVVNGTAITSGDVAKRQAFLRLQKTRPTPRPPRSN